MRIHIVCTKNGQLNEGMNNIEAHLSKRFTENGNEISYSSLRDIAGLLKKAKQSDCILIFARPNLKTYAIATLASNICKNTWFFVVQRPEQSFISLNAIKTLHCNYLYLREKDVDILKVHRECQKIQFSVGLNTDKFVPVNKEKAQQLKQKHGFIADKPLVVHVGHASKGRGVEDLAIIDSNKYQKLFVDSGLFDNPEQRKYLEQNNVRILAGYIENIQEIYQMADAYLFPTKEGNYVISVPLSVMEALSCGTAAVSYKIMEVPSRVPGYKESSIFEIETIAEIEGALQNAIRKKSAESLLRASYSWNEIADIIENEISL